MHAIYVRVSTVGQNEAGQKREIERWLKGNGIPESDVRWYVDKWSGDNLNRPAFERLQRDIFHGEIETVVVWKLDRLSRSMRDGINDPCHLRPQVAGGAAVAREDRLFARVGTGFRQFRQLRFGEVERLVQQRDVHAGNPAASQPIELFTGPQFGGGNRREFHSRTCRLLCF